MSYRTDQSLCPLFVSSCSLFTVVFIIIVILIIFIFRITIILLLLIISFFFFAILSSAVFIYHCVSLSTLDLFLVFIFLSVNLVQFPPAAVWYGVPVFVSRPGLPASAVDRDAAGDDRAPVPPAPPPAILRVQFDVACLVGGHGTVSGPDQLDDHDRVVDGPRARRRGRTRLLRPHRANGEAETLL